MEPKELRPILTWTFMVVVYPDTWMKLRQSLRSRNRKTNQYRIFCIVEYYLGLKIIFIKLLKIEQRV